MKGIKFLAIIKKITASLIDLRQRTDLLSLRFRAPRFWYKKNSILGLILCPIGLLYGFISRYQQSLAKPYKASVPVVCIGNLTLGGSGKTPTAIAISKLLMESGFNPHILSRGYGGHSHVAHLVSYSDNPNKVGDEALLMAHHAPVWVGKNRAITAHNALHHKADFLIMDDGLQNQTLHKDIKLIVVDGEQGFGNNHVFPAGPLRTPLKEGLEIASAFILIHPSDSIEQYLKQSGKPIFKASYHPVLPIPRQEVIAFTGIGYPQKFKTFLEKHGYYVKVFLDFPDHHVYSEGDYEKINEIQQSHKLPVLTTEKDLVKIDKQRIEKLFSVPITLDFEDTNAFDSWFIKRLEILLKTGTLSQT